MKRQGKNMAAITVLMFLLLTATSVTAFSNSQKRQGPGGAPPPEAIKACEGKIVGDTTSFKGRRGETVKATCKEIEGTIAAVPEGGPKPPQ